MMICYDKAFPESARALALDGAEIVVCMSAWPAQRTDRGAGLAEDRWTRRFDLFDRARALENQIVWVSANQAGTFGSMRSSRSAKIVDPGGDVLATTGVAAGLAVADVDVDDALDAGPPVHGAPARPAPGRLPATRRRRPASPRAPARRDAGGPDRRRRGPLRPRPRRSTSSGSASSSTTPGTPGPRCWCCPTRALGGYLADLRHPDPDALPPALEPDGDRGPVGDRLRRRDGGLRRVLRGADGDDGPLQRGGLPHRRRRARPAPQGPPAGRRGRAAYAAGRRVRRVRHPGRAGIGMLIDYDKTFPESARTLAARRRRDPRLPVRLADQHHQPRAADGPGPPVPAVRPLRPGPRRREPGRAGCRPTRPGATAALRFLGQAKVVGPGGDILARTWAKAGLAVAEVDVARRWRSGPAGAAPPAPSVRPDDLPGADA